MYHEYIEVQLQHTKPPTNYGCHETHTKTKYWSFLKEFSFGLHYSTITANMEVKVEKVPKKNINMYRFTREKWCRMDTLRKQKQNQTRTSDEY